MDATCH
jgi:hypothetical protein